MPEKERDAEQEVMHHRQIMLADGRYMIFYTFGDSSPDALATVSIREANENHAVEASPLLSKEADLESRDDSNV